MTQLTPQQLSQLQAVMQNLLPSQVVKGWDSSTPLLGAIAEFDSMLLANLLGALESQFAVELDDADLSIEYFESWGSLQGFVSDLLNH